MTDAPSRVLLLRDVPLSNGTSALLLLLESGALLLLPKGEEGEKRLALSAARRVHTFRWAGGRPPRRILLSPDARRLFLSSVLHRGADAAVVVALPAAADAPIGGIEWAEPAATICDAAWRDDGDALFLVHARLPTMLVQVTLASSSSLETDAALLAARGGLRLDGAAVVVGTAECDGETRTWAGDVCAAAEALLPPSIVSDGRCRARVFRPRRGALLSLLGPPPSPFEHDGVGEMTRVASAGRGRLITWNETGCGEVHVWTVAEGKGWTAPTFRVHAFALASAIDRAFAPDDDSPKVWVLACAARADGQLAFLVRRDNWPETACNGTGVALASLADDGSTVSPVTYIPLTPLLVREEDVLAFKYARGTNCTVVLRCGSSSSSVWAVDCDARCQPRAALYANDTLAVEQRLHGRHYWISAASGLHTAGDDDDNMPWTSGVAQPLGPGAPDSPHQLHTAVHAATLALPLCAACQVALVQPLTCSRCHGVAYCSPLCQNADWTTRHAAMCTM